MDKKKQNHVKGLGKPNHVRDQLRLLINLGNDIDDIIYNLTEVAIERRAIEDKPGGNRAEHDYWQKIIEILHDTQEKLENI